MITEFDFTFCPKCGGNLEKKEGNLLLCSNCNFHYYVNPKPSNAVIIKNIYDEILLVKRKHDPQKGFWDLPGGFIDIKETIEESIQREMKEELEVEITHVSYFTSMHDTYNYGGINAFTICAAFTAELPPNVSIKPNDDVEEVKFFPLEKIDYEVIAFESIKNILKKYKNNRH